MLFKVLRRDGSSPIAALRWELPRGGEAGAWMPPVEGPLQAGANGYHLVTPEGLIGLGRLCPSTHSIYLAEGRGDFIDGAMPGCRSYREARLLRRLDLWDEAAHRQFAADCLERVVRAYARCYPQHGRVIAFAADCLEALRHPSGRAGPLLSGREARHAWRHGGLSRQLVSTAAAFLENLQPDMASATPYCYARVLTAALARTGAWEDRDEHWNSVRDREMAWQAGRLLHYLGVREDAPTVSHEERTGPAATR